MSRHGLGCNLIWSFNTLGSMTLDHLSTLRYHVNTPNFITRKGLDTLKKASSTYLSDFV